MAMFVKCVWMCGLYEVVTEFWRVCEGGRLRVHAVLLIGQGVGSCVSVECFILFYWGGEDTLDYSW